MVLELDGDRGEATVESVLGGVLLVRISDGQQVTRSGIGQADVAGEHLACAASSHAQAFHTGSSR